MARIAGIDIPRDKRVVVSLTYIYGIGRPTAEKILSEVGINESVRVKDLTEEDLNKFRQEVTKYQIEGDLRRETQANIKRLMDIGSYRGIRHRRNLPVRGQTQETTHAQEEAKLKLPLRRKSRRSRIWHVKDR